MVDKLVCIYAGAGAVLARDVEVALDKLALPYCEVSEQDIRSNKLEDCSLLIIPGGYTAQCVDALGEEGFEQIREFVAGGGGYISLCAGAYLAARPRGGRRRHRLGDLRPGQGGHLQPSSGGKSGGRG